MQLPTLSLALIVHLTSSLCLPLIAKPELLHSILNDSDDALLHSTLTDSSPPSPTSPTTVGDEFPNWSRSASWLGFRVVEHESHVQPILPTEYAQEWHLVNSPIRGLVTDEMAKHRLGITAKELDRVFHERVVRPQLRIQEAKSGTWQDVRQVNQDTSQREQDAQLARLVQEEQRFHEIPIEEP